MILYLSAPQLLPKCKTLNVQPLIRSDETDLWIFILKKTPRSLNINVHHWPASKIRTHVYWRRTDLYILLNVWSICILVYKIKICLITLLEKILDVFLISYFLITEFPEYFFFLNSIYYFSPIILQYFKFWKFLFFLIFKFLLFLLKKGDL